jgi:hypothetical protein
MKYQYISEKDWLLVGPDALNRIIVADKEYARLNTPCEFEFPESIVKSIRDNYKADEEKGGVILFRRSRQNGKCCFTAANVVFITNVTEHDKRTSYLADSKGLDTAYGNALKEKLFPLAFHTHPTIYPDSDQDAMQQGMNFLEQLNTSIADKGATLWCFTYNGVSIRLPEFLIVENSGALFIGLYGGLVAPLCFTQQKSKAVQDGMKRTFNGIKDWANTPERQTIVALTVLTLIFLAIKYPKVALPAIVVGAAIIPPLIYENQEKNEFFGITRRPRFRIHIPKIEDTEIIKYELLAIESHEEAKRATALRKK